MPRKIKAKKNSEINYDIRKTFNVDFLNEGQKEAWNEMEQNHVTFLLGPAGVGKTLLACSYALNEILNERKSKIVLTRPIVEAGEKLGYLPYLEPSKKRSTRTCSRCLTVLINA